MEKHTTIPDTKIRGKIPPGFSERGHHVRWLINHILDVTGSSKACTKTHDPHLHKDTSLVSVSKSLSLTEGAFLRAGVRHWGPKVLCWLPPCLSVLFFNILCLQVGHILLRRALSNRSPYNNENLLYLHCPLW